MFCRFGSAAAAVCCFVCAAGVACVDGYWCWLLVLVHVLMALLVLMMQQPIPTAKELTIPVAPHKSKTLDIETY